MFKQSASHSSSPSCSNRAVCQAMFLVAAILFQSFPAPTRGAVLAKTNPEKKIASDPTSKRQNLPAPKVFPQPAPVTQKPSAPQAAVIVATNRDSFPDHTNGGKAVQGDVINYSVAITNTGDANATSVVFNDTVDVNTSTLVGGSPQILFTLTGDTYSAIGNVRINTSTIAPGSGQTVLENDTPNGATLTGFGSILANANGTVPNGSNTVTTTNGGTVTMNANGSFTYNPPVGFGGAGITDSFFYTLTNSTIGTGFPNGFPSGSARVTINVSTPIWFINQAAAGGGDGRLSTPFNCLTGAGCFSAVNDGVGNHPAAGDFIFMYKNPVPPAAFTGGVTLLNNQQLIGEGASASLASIVGVAVPPGSDPLPSTGNAPPVITTAGAVNGINLAVGASNTLRGFTIGNTGGFKIASGASFGTLTTLELLLNGTGGALSLTSGALAATFTSIQSFSSTTQGITLGSVTGSLTATGGTSISGNTTQCILMTGSSANADFGNTTCSGGTDGISLNNNASGTRTFGTLSVSGNSGIGFLHAVGGGNTTINGAAGFNSSGNNIDIQNMAASTSINFASAVNVTKTTTGGAGVNLANNNATSSVTFGNLGITTSNGTALSATTGGTINVTNATNSISATGVGAQTAPAIVANSVTLNANFSAVSCNGSGTGGNCISLTTVPGTSNFGSGSLTGAAGATFLINGSNGTVTYNGTITQGNAARVVDIQNKTGGTISLGGAISSTGGTGTGIILSSNTGATINFTGGIALTTNANDAFTATSSGTISATQNNTSIVNTLTTTSGQALKVTNTTIGASGLTFRSIASGAGANNGITLDTTGASAGLTVTGNGTPASGGTISGKTGADSSTTSGIGIYLNSTSSVSLTRMDIEGCQNYGIRGNNVTGFTLDNSSVGATSINGTSNTADADPTGYNSEGSVRFYNLLGSATISNSTLDLGFGKTLAVANDTGTLNRLTITNCTIRNNQPASGVADSLFAQSSSNATLNFTVNGASQFTATRGAHIVTSAQGTSTMDIQINGGCVFSNILDALPAGGGFNLQSSGTDSLVTFNINGNSFRQGSAGHAPLNTVGRLITAGTVSGNSKFDGKIINNTFGVTGVAFSGGGNGADAIGLFATGNQAGTTRVTGTKDSRFLVQGNTIKHYGQTGVQINARQGNSILDATVFGNTINEPGSIAGGAFAAVWVNAGALGPDTNTVNVVIGDASVAANKNTMQDSDPNNIDDVFLDRNSCAGCTAQLNLYRNGSGAAAGMSEAIDRQIIVDDNNPTLDLLAGFTNGSGPTIGTPAGAPPQPTLAPPAPDDLAITPATKREIFAPTFNADKLVVAAVVSSPVSQITTSAVQNERTDNSFAATRTARLNHSAAAEVKPQANHRAAATTPAKAASLEAAAYRSREVRLYHAARKASADDKKPNTPQSGGQVTINVGTITPGSSAVLNFQVTVNNAAPPGATQISNQGTVTGNGPGAFSVMTDDPDTVAANDPTITPIVHPTAADGVISGRITRDDGTPVEGAVVNLGGGQTRKTITDAEGNYHFNRVDTSGFYTVTPARANYSFNPFNRSFSLVSNQTEAAFTGTMLGDNLNPSDTPEYFVRQQYVDILGREPDETGFNYWSDKILACNSDVDCTLAQRTGVAAAFFIENEFRLSGAFIYNVYEGALGRRPVYSEYSVDRKQVVGGPTLDAQKQAFAAAFVARAEFASRYENNTTAESFVDALLANVQQASGVDLSSQRDSLIGRYNTGASQTEARTFVLRDVTESTAVRNANYNGAFVLVEYFGYLRRNPDRGGYDFWLGVLNTGDPGNYRGMVCSFITSTEYQRRFSQVVSHGNGECGQ